MDEYENNEVSYSLREILLFELFKKKKKKIDHRLKMDKLRQKKENGLIPSFRKII